MSNIMCYHLTPVHHGDGQLIVRIVDILDNLTNGINWWESWPFTRCPNAFKRNIQLISVIIKQETEKMHTIGVLWR